jgi:hypothetical protein
MKRRKWNETDRQAFADGSRTRAQTHTDKRKQADKQACRKWKWNGV